ncbi:MAG: choice-of-anchor R domain-containing protein [Terriglobia bacterium]
MSILLQDFKQVMTCLAVLAVSLFTAAPRAKADVVASNFTPSDAFISSFAVGGINSDNPQALGVSFTVPNQDYTFEDAQLVMFLNSGTSAVDINLQTDNSGMPSGNILETIELDNALSASPGVLTFTSSSNPVLTALQTYWLIAYVPDASTNAGWVENVEGDNSSPAGNFVFNTADSATGPWTVAGAGLARPAFEIDGTPGGVGPPPPPVVPEPGSWVLLGTGIAALGLLAFWKSRRAGAAS